MRAARLAALALLVLACRTPAMPRMLPVLGEDLRIQAWLRSARSEAETRVGVRAIGRVRLEGPRGSSRVRQVIIAERPGRLRLESLNLLGQTASLLVTDGERYAFFDGRSVERGGVFPELLRDTLGMDVAPQEAVALLIAAPGLPDRAPLQVLGRDGQRLALYATEHVGFTGDGELVEVAATRPDGSVRWRAEYGAWRDAGVGRYPYRMVFSFPATALRAEIELDSVELNPILAPDLFSLLLEESE